MTDHPHVNETSTGGYMPRERIPAETYRGPTDVPVTDADETAQQADLPEITVEQIEHAVAAVLAQFEIEPVAAGELIGAVIEGHDAGNVDGQLVNVVSTAATEHGYPNLDVTTFCRVVDEALSSVR